MSAPSLLNVMQTPLREFAGAKVLLFFDICKKLNAFLNFDWLLEDRS